MSAERALRIRRAIAGGLCFGGLELIAALVAPAPGVGASAADAALSLLGLALASAAIGGLPAGDRIWALILAASAAPHAGRIGGLPWLGLAAVLPVAVAAIRWPRVALGLAASTALLTPALVERPEPPPRERAETTRPDLILVTIDTLRADAPLDPGPGAWSRYTQSIAAAPWTLPSMDAVMTGLPVRSHGGGLPAGEGRYTRPDPSLPRLAERLAERGYTTMAVVSNPHLRSELGFERGFDSFEHTDSWVEPLFLLHTLQSRRHRWAGQLPRLRHLRDPLIVDRALATFEAAGDGAPRFLWVHLLGPHEYARDPWTPPPGWSPGVEDPEVLRAAYGVNAAEAGRQLRRLLDGIPAGAGVAITSDHGEALGEGESWGHGTAFDEPQIRVPLLLRAPAGPEGTPEPTTDDAQVAAWDAHAALLHMADGEDPPPRLREVVELGGIRRDATAFALRVEGGDLSPRAPPAQLGEATELPEDVWEGLRAIGYVE